MAKPKQPGFLKRVGMAIFNVAADSSESNANTQFSWQMKGLDDPEKRGQDRADDRYARVQKEIETSRKRDPLIFRGVDYYDKLGIGIGIELSAIDDKGADVLQAAQAVWEVNDLDDGQHQMSGELVTTGNLFIRVPVEFEGKIPLVQLLPNAQIERIATKDGRPWYYRRKWTELEFKEPKVGVQSGRTALISTSKIKYEDIPAEEIVHVAINRTAGELRGLSMLEPTIYWTALYGRIMQTTWAAAVAHAMVANHIVIEEATPEQVDATVAKIEKQLITQTDPRGQTYKAMGTGQMLLTGKNVEIRNLAANLSAGSLDNETRRVLLMAACGMGTPEFVLSDGDNANRATTESQSDPYFRMMQAHQHVIIKALRKAYRLVFDRYVALGMFKGMALPEGKEHLADWLKFTAPNLLTPDLELLGPVAAQLVQANIWSRRYANEQLGGDPKLWDRMMQEIADEKAAGFESAPLPQQIPPSSRAAQMNLPLAADAGREESETPTKKRKREFEKLLAAFKAEAADSQGDVAKIQAAGQKMLAEAKLIMFGLIDDARRMGAESLAA